MFLFTQDLNFFFICVSPEHLSFLQIPLPVSKYVKFLQQFQKVIHYSSTFQLIDLLLFSGTTRLPQTENKSNDLLLANAIIVAKVVAIIVNMIFSSYCSILSPIKQFTASFTLVWSGRLQCLCVQWLCCLYHYFCTTLS